MQVGRRYGIRQWSWIGERYKRALLATSSFSSRRTRPSALLERKVFVSQLGGYIRLAYLVDRI